MHFFYQTAKELAHVNFFWLHMRKLIHSCVERIGVRRECESEEVVQKVCNMNILRGYKKDDEDCKYNEPILDNS